MMLSIPLLQLNKLRIPDRFLPCKTFRMKMNRRSLALASLALPLFLVIFVRLYSSPKKFEPNLIQKRSASSNDVSMSARFEDSEYLDEKPRVVPPSSPLSDFILDGKIPLDDRPRLPPLEALKTYIFQHSQESLWRDYESNNTDHRRFSVVHYSCPQQLGNRLHHFFNDFLFAYITNRTLLWKYWDRETCIQLGNKYDHSICSDINRTLSIDNPLQACNPILQTADWIPSYDDWSQRLNLEKSVQVWIHKIHPHNAPHLPPQGVERIQLQSSPLVGDNESSPLSSSNNQTNNNAVGVSSKWKLAVFQPMVGLLQPGFVKNKLTQDSYHLDRVAALFAHGADFWFGLLFDQAFRFRPAFLSTIKPSILTLADQEEEEQESKEEDFNHHLSFSLSIAIHSRHTESINDGTNITNEVACLMESVFPIMTQHNLTSCQVYMLSDRPQTLNALQDWFAAQIAFNCTLLHAQHSSSAMTETIGLEVEHGPWSGAGFVQDLELASREASRSIDYVALIGHKRSSSMLLSEWTTYKRAIRLWKDRGVDPSLLPPPISCQLPG